MKQRKIIPILNTALFLIMLLVEFIHAEKYSSPLFDVTIEGKGRPIILIHGYASEKSVWDETVEFLKTDYQCHIIQLAGFAGKERATRKNLLVNYRDGIKDYIITSNLKDVILIGHSMGGFLSLWLASKYPDLIAKVVSVDGVPFLSAVIDPNATSESQMEFAKKTFNFENDFEALENQMSEEQLNRIFSTMTIDENKISILQKWTDLSDDRTKNQAMFELMVTDIREDVKKIKAPVLVFGAWIAYKHYGATKESTMELYNIQFENVADYTIELTDKGKHFIMWDDFEWYSSRLNDFLIK